MVTGFSMIPALLSLIAAIACRAISELALHGKLKWSTKGFGFWGEDSYLRKYRNGHKEKGKFQVQIPLDNFYYNTFKIKYREAFPLSATALVFLTDGMHMMQFLYHLFLSLTLALLYGFSYIVWGSCWGIIVCTHSLVYHLLSKKV